MLVRLGNGFTKKLYSQPLQRGSTLHRLQQAQCSTSQNKNIKELETDLRDLNNQKVDLETLFDGKKVVVLGVVGAFTPVCSLQHIPDFMKHTQELKKSGIDKITCVSVNDPFVLKAWKKELGLNQEIELLADWDASFSKALSLTHVLNAAGLGLRCTRFVLVVEDGEIQFQAEEKHASDFVLTTAKAVLRFLQQEID